MFSLIKKIGHGGCTRNRIGSATAVTEFPRTFLVFEKWPDLTNSEGMLRSIVICSVKHDTSFARRVVWGIFRADDTDIYRLSQPRLRYKFVILGPTFWKSKPRATFCARASHTWREVPVFGRHLRSLWNIIFYRLLRWGSGNVLDSGIQNVSSDMFWGRQARCILQLLVLK